MAFGGDKRLEWRDLASVAFLSQLGANDRTHTLAIALQRGIIEI
jgi:hypothetical protein